ncbi:MAG TPA: hypothetical protein VGX28_16755 [Frankiaceae bacterium]|jgi:hypothetical protein|nr:hypothetical protein [Frankiaceae bacterium]
MRRLPVLLASALLASAVACGGDDGGPAASPTPSPTTASPTASAMTKEAYVAAANALCARVDKETESLPDEPGTAKELLDGTRTYLASLKKAQGELRALTPPAADAEEVEKNFLAVGDKQVEVLEGLLPELEAAAAKNDKAAAEKALQDGFQEFETVSTDAVEEWMTQYGLTDCG